MKRKSKSTTGFRDEGLENGKANRHCCLGLAKGKEYRKYRVMGYIASDHCKVSSPFLPSFLETRNRAL